ncbi:MAG: amidophosphoribosyltransferase [candidate division SR1 bacterium]|nr:amidophosphoribosyltransferase [candidate division SR1 bacterium]
MCGIVGSFGYKEVSTEIYEALIHLQHRGQDAAGILTYKNSDSKRFYLRKGQGLVRNVFNEAKYLIEDLPGHWGLGHIRYPTSGSAFDLINAQPFHTSYPYGIAMVHNGNLTNYEELKKWLLVEKKILCNSGSDLECILNIFATRLGDLDDKNDFFENLCDSVENVYKKARGGYSVISIIAGKGMIAFRDPHGIRPLVIGKKTNLEGKNEYIFASETNMFYSLGYETFGDVGNGEAVFIDTDGNMHRKKIYNESFTPDAFEYIYFARPDAIINDVSVYRSRLRMGQNLANKWKLIYPDIIPDVVIPVPFSANVAALSLASELGVRYTEGLYKNPFIGRTFIMDSQNKRQQSVRQKLSPQKYEINGKKVMVVDDSIVRGTTSKEVVNILKDAGAKEIYFVSACPPLFYPDFYGISIPTQDELIASKMTHEELRKYLQVDKLLFQDIDGLTEAIIRKGKQHIDKLSMPYFNCDYVTNDIDISQFKKVVDFEA